MEWSKFIQPYRVGCPKDGYDGTRARSEFHRDYDRIIFSAAFRRLYGKTQVVPFPNSDVTHTRLAHSLETASVGRSLGNLVKDANAVGLSKIPYDIGALISASCLCHDIGNPPFGHAGEAAIAEFFKNESTNKEITNLLDDRSLHEFQKFDGNAMGLHMLTYSNPRKTKAEGGVGLTYPVVAAYIKYPTHASCVSNDKIEEKKAGIFSSEIRIVSDIFHELGVKKKEKESWYRHPLAFLTEASDDICNVVIDYEDGYKENLISFSDIEEKFLQIIEPEKDTIKIDTYPNVLDQREKAGYLRAKAIYSLILQVSRIFVENVEEICSFRFNSNLLKSVPTNRIIKEINDDSKKRLYSRMEVLKNEAAAFTVLPGLLSIFLKAAINPETEKHRKILSILPKEVHKIEKRKEFENFAYEIIMDIVCYVCGMTDNYAVDLYRILTGSKLCNY